MLENLWKIQFRLKVYTTGSERLYIKEKKYFPEVQTLICPFCHNIYFFFYGRTQRGVSFRKFAGCTSGANSHHLGKGIFQKCKKSNKKSTVMHQLLRPGQIKFTLVSCNYFAFTNTNTLIFLSSHERKDFKDTKRFYITKLQF